MFKRPRFCINRTEGAASHTVSLFQRMIPNYLCRAFQKPHGKTNC